MTMRKSSVLSLILTMIIIPVLVLSSVPVLTVRAEGEDEPSETEEKSMIVMKISTEEELLEIAQKCHDDFWSLDKTIELTDDIELTGEFPGFPIFNGVFDGKGHTIRNYTYSGDNSITGFINEIGKDGYVKNLTLEVNIRTEDDVQCIGAVAGINAGIIENCKVSGLVIAGSEVGGIVGINQYSGLINRAQNDAQISGFYYTGGIAGKNYGIIAGSKNRGNINSSENWIEMEDENTGSSLLGVEDTTGLISVHSGVDTGGIAGFSEGLIHRSENGGTVGYEHAGYNIGGIAGRQSGIIFSSFNVGYVYGKKDVGGVIGQQEPYIEVDQGKSLKYATAQIERDVDKLIADADAAEDSLSADLHTLKLSSDAVKDSVNKITQDASDSKQDVTTDAENKGNQISGKINEIKNGIDLPVDIDKIRDEKEKSKQDVQNRKNSLANENESWTADMESLSMNLDAMSEVLDRIGKNSKNNADKLSRDVDNLNESLDSTYNLMSDIKNGLEEEGVSYLFTDLSEEALDMDLTGRAVNCVNKGVVKGDIEIGGIVGAMAIDDENLESNQIITFGLKTGEAYSTVNVLRRCTNEGFVSSRKDKTGGIAGYMQQGVIHDCRGYGNVKSEERNYVGGICGLSEGSITGSYVLCSISGNSYVGGVAGSTVKIKDCTSMPLMKCTGDNTGAVAGEIPRDKLTKENNFEEVLGNVFVSDDHYGIDKVNYADIAEKLTYKELCEREGLPSEFKHLTVTFRVDDETVQTNEYAYGADLTGIACPEIEGAAGSFVHWPDLSGEKMLGNLVVEAEFLQNITVIPSELKDNENVAVFVGGEFNYDDGISVSALTKNEIASRIPDVADAKDFRAYRVEVSESAATEDGRKAGDFSYAVRIYNPFKYCRAWMITEGDGGEVKELEKNERGSYLAAQMPGNGAVYVITETANPLYKKLIIAGAAAATVILIVVIIVITFRRKKKKHGVEKEA